MAVLIRLNDLSIGFRGPPLLDGVTCQIESGQRIGLLGRNGSGKTTLMRILSGEVAPDHGQSIVVAGREGFAPAAGSAAQTWTAALTTSSSPACRRSERDESHLWQSQQRVERLLSQMSLDGNSGREHALVRHEAARALGAGARLRARRAAARRADEPSRHRRDRVARRFPAPLAERRLMFVTHDRMFLRKLATRILEIDRGRLFDWSCDYDTFLVRKEAALAAEEKQNALFDKKLAEEEVWIRTGHQGPPHAQRRPRAGARSSCAVERSERRDSDRQGASSRFRTAQRSGMLVAEVDDVSFAYGERTIVRDFSTTHHARRQDRHHRPQRRGQDDAAAAAARSARRRRRAPCGWEPICRSPISINCAQQLDEEATVQDNVGDGDETVRIGGSSRHVIGYLQDFLFSPERARTPVRFLSGGERNRLLLARLFAKPANVIVLDEPTNDLDTETLELLEERLVEFDGTVLLVSHDRAFLNNVVTSTIVFEAGGVREYVGGYDDWLRQRPRTSPATKAKVNQRLRAGSRSNESTSRNLQSAASPTTKSASSNCCRQESKRSTAEIAELHDAMAQPDFYKQPSTEIARKQTQLKEFSRQLTDAYRRWEELESFAD